MAATFDFGGRASRGTFWSFTLVTIVIGLVASIADAALHTGQTLNGIVGLIHAVPSLSAQVRRLYDLGRSGWWLLLTVTLVGVVPLLIWFCRRGEPGPNRYGMGGADTRSVPGDGIAHEPALGGLGGPSQTPNSAEALVPPARKRSTASQVGRGLLLVLGLAVGIFGLAHVNGFRFSSAPSCSADEVTALVQKLVREDLEKGELGALMEPGKTRVEMGAIRTRSTTGRASECAALVTLGIAFRPEFVAANPDDVLSMRSRSQFDTDYRAGLTDDHQHVYVTVKGPE